jgi:heme-degrading monooxygenase HmoA
MSADRFAHTPAPPYYAVIFTAQRSAVEEGYGATAERMAQLAAAQPGYLGIEHSRDETGLGITVSYWESEQAILAWKDELEHRAARQQGRDAWYLHYQLRVAKVERAYGWQRRDSGKDAT